MNKKLISWLMVVLWMALIFNFSHQPREDSNKLSTSITEKIVEIVEKVSPNRHINIRTFNHILRKNAHFFLYLVLGLLVANALKFSGHKGINIFLMALIICMVYVISDEVH